MKLELEVIVEMTILFPVLLAGGSGTRLWPLSRKSYPKQFANLTGETTLFQNSAKRLISSDLIEFSPHITLTNAEFRFIVGEQLQEVGIDSGPILIEPEGKNTAAAILAASVFSHSKDKDAVLLVAPSDHVIPDVRAFHEAISIGLKYVKNGKMVTFGIKPTHPETGYGYLELSTDLLDSTGTSDVVSFVEKPDLRRAEQMKVDGNFLWNAGIFLFRATDMIAAFETYAPKTLNLVSKAIDDASLDLGFLRLSRKHWSKLQDISIDYAIMEKAKNLIAVPFISKWTDLGGWDSVWLESSKDHSKNVTSEGAYAVDCSNSLLRAESEGQKIVGLGLDNILAIAMPDAVLVATKDRAQNVRKVVDLLRKNNVPQAHTFPKDHRPWGWFESLLQFDGFQVKRIFVKPGAALSLQSHKFRSEHWVVVEGEACVTIDDTVISCKLSESVYIPVGAKHRLENKSASPLVIIEVQTGSYLGEDDIVRFDDQYNRGSTIVK
jgi:mannose-1-phosphate guanylyltransferase/mannose-6-phosphate isomerase